MTLTEYQEKGFEIMQNEKLTEQEKNKQLKELLYIYIKPGY